MTAKWIPNALTLMRCVLAFVAAGAVLLDEQVARTMDAAMGDWFAAGQPPRGAPDYPETLDTATPMRVFGWSAIAFGAFIIASVTDYVDGALARMMDAHSAFGAWLDPIADKLLVGLVLIALSLTSANWWIIIPTAIIVARDGFISWLRARLGGGYAMPVMRMAKWKTSAEMVAIGLLLAYPLAPAVGFFEGHGGQSVMGVHLVHGGIILERLGITLLLAAALLSAVTGWAYWRSQRDGGGLGDTFR